MKHRTSGLAVCLAAAVSIVALAAPAMAGEPNNDYQGRAEHDTGTYVGFDVVKQNGKSKVTNVVGVLSYHCSNGGHVFGAESQGSLKIDDKKRFDGNLNIPTNVRGGALSAHYELSGKLTKDGKAKGIIQGIVVFPSRGPGSTPTGRCYTGGLRYTLKKGADVPLPLKSEGGRR